MKRSGRKLSPQQVQERAKQLRAAAAAKKAAPKKAVKKVAPVAPVNDKEQRAEVKGLLGDLYKEGLLEVADALGADYRSKATNAQLIGVILAVGKATDYGVVKAAIDKL